MSSQEGLDQLPGKRFPNHLSAETKDIYVVIFDALTSGEHIMDESCAHAGNLVRGDGDSDAATAERDSALNLTIGNSLGQRDDEVWVIIRRIQSVRTEVHDVVP